MSLPLNEIIHGDCLEVMREMGSESVDLVFADPPYNSNLNYIGYSDNLPEEEYWIWLENVAHECARISKMSIIKHSALKINQWCKHMPDSRMVVWYKPFSRGFRKNGFATHFEPLWVLKGKTIKWSKDVIIQNSGNSNKEQNYDHPAQMPEGLAEQIIDICCPKGGVVLDPFIGSGTTAIAALNTGRFFIGIEKEEKYVEIARKRIAEHQQQLTFEAIT